jgi:hypothetical protein
MERWFFITNILLIFIPLSVYLFHVWSLLVSSVIKRQTQFHCFFFLGQDRSFVSSNSRVTQGHVVPLYVIVRGVSLPCWNLVTKCGILVRKSLYPSGYKSSVASHVRVWLSVRENFSWFNGVVLYFNGRWHFCDSLPSSKMLIEVKFVCVFIRVSVRAP